MKVYFRFQKFNENEEQHVLEVDRQESEEFFRMYIRDLLRIYNWVKIEFDINVGDFINNTLILTGDLPESMNGTMEMFYKTDNVTLDWFSEMLHEISTEEENQYVLS